MIKDIYSLEEKKQVIKAVKLSNNKETTMKQLLGLVGVTNTNRYRFVIDLLIEQGYIKKTLVRQLSANYKRYSYTLLKEEI